jgi:hypothetical protein
MKLTSVALVAFALSSPFALANTPQHNENLGAYSAHRALSMQAYGEYPAYRDAAPPVILHPNDGNPNGDPDGPTTLSGTGSSQYGGASPGTSGHN